MKIGVGSRTSTLSLFSQGAKGTLGMAENRRLVNYCQKVDIIFKFKDHFLIFLVLKNGFFSLIKTFNLKVSRLKMAKRISINSKASQDLKIDVKNRFKLQARCAGGTASKLVYR